MSKNIIYRKFNKIISFVIIFSLLSVNSIFADINDYSYPINNMNLYDSRYEKNDIVVIGDESAELFRVNVYMGFKYIIEENATLAKLKNKIKEAKKYHPSLILFYLGPHDYLENTSIKEFKDKIVECRNQIRSEYGVNIGFFSYLDYNGNNGNHNSCKDYDDAIRACANEYTDIKYIDTRYAANKNMLSSDNEYNKEYLFYAKYAIINLINEMNDTKPRIVFVGDSRTVGLSVVNEKKFVEFIGVPAGKYLEFEKTMENVIKKFYSNCKVVILYGINDIDKHGNTYVEKYVNYLNDYHNDFFARNMELYIASVMEQEDLVNVITFPRNYTLYSRNGALNYLDSHVHVIDLYTYMFIITAKLGKDEVFADEIHFTDEASKLILEYLYDNLE